MQFFNSYLYIYENRVYMGTYPGASLQLRVFGRIQKFMST